MGESNILCCLFRLFQAAFQLRCPAAASVSACCFAALNFQQQLFFSAASSNLSAPHLLRCVVAAASQSRHGFVGLRPAPAPREVGLSDSE